MLYKKKPVIIDAFCYDGDFKNSSGEYYIPNWAVKAFEDGELFFKGQGELYIKTLEGDMHDGENEELCSLYCLAFGEGLCGLHDWIRPSGNINAIGNLHERDFDNDDIEKALSVLAMKFPTLVLTLHSGDDWESSRCTATFHVKDGECKRCPPEIEELSEISSESMMGNLWAALGCNGI